MSATDRGPPGAAARAVLTVDLRRTAENYRTLAGKCAKARVGAVVKADAYGLGLPAIAPALHAAGCRDFFVADVEEGMALRALVTASQIFVLNGPPREAVGEFVRHSLIPVLNDLDQVAIWNELARKTQAPPAALHIDSGMTRLGLSMDDVEILAKEPDRLAGIQLACVMSHLACSDQPDNPMNARQLAAFRAARAKLPEAPASLANSAGVFLGPDYHFDLVRVGGALYGLSPFQTEPSPLAQTVRLEAPILQLRDVDSPMTVGYGAIFRVAGRGRIATIPVGYADGYPRSLSNRGSAFLGGFRIPIVGRVSMDLTTLDVSGVPASYVQLGAMVELIGADHKVDDLADEAGTIGHAVLTGFGRRILRRYET